MGHYEEYNVPTICIHICSCGESITNYSIKQSQRVGICETCLKNNRDNNAKKWRGDTNVQQSSD